MFIFCCMLHVPSSMTKSTQFNKLRIGVSIMVIDKMYNDNAFLLDKTTYKKTERSVIRLIRCELS